MATKNYEHECKELVENIQNGVSQTRCTLRDFLKSFVDFDEILHSEKDVERRAKRYEKLMQRVKNKKSSTQETFDKLKVIYKFLLDKDEYKKLNDYKPLADDKFEREILGDEIYENIATNSEKNFSNINKNYDTQPCD
ncbi:hypothetical protein [Campylobacter concisus]|uniref:Uncharacterized protein n=1 Tax=Campylobacter concisus ATCC 51562 TaxID=1242969 RepID=U2F8D9_9BACT|nr:hypothetical protein [Campylobacter concisus]ERJ26225.1 hypothetical protein ATCC51562_184 [Campylobacter concisus ATCC 51562]